MPCRSDYMEPNAHEKAEAAELRKQMEEIGNKACHGADVLREYILGNVAAQKMLPLLNQKLEQELHRLAKLDAKPYVHVGEGFKEQIAQLVDEYEKLNELVTTVGKDSVEANILEAIEAEQIEHREQDLKRLMKTFGDSGDREKLAKVLGADNRKPLAVQLGFDPNDY